MSRFKKAADAGTLVIVVAAVATLVLLGVFFIAQNMGSGVSGAMGEAGGALTKATNELMGSP